jgi:methyltransferase (TIGR00027 family)
MSEIENQVSQTSQYVAAARAVEHKRADRLFSDPLAEKLAGKKIISEILPLIEEYEKRGKPMIEVRTRFFDDFLLASTTDIRQVIILGAGMDTRSFRLPWHPDTYLYEIDRPEVMQRKESLLGSTPAKCHRHSLAIDLRQLWSEQLIETGFQPSKPSVWLLEGLLYYLTETEVRTLLRTISDLTAQGSKLGADLVNEKNKQEKNQRLDRRWAKLWQSGCDEPEKLFAEFGWQASVVQYGDRAASFGRFKYKYPPREVPDVVRVFLVTANRRSILKTRFS